jgi:hypothetical protein
MKRALSGGILVLGFALSPLARADWSAFAEIERFRWKEDVSPSVTETGPMIGLGVRWTQGRPARLRFAYEARLYGGSENYDGALLFSGTPITGTTEYVGVRQEGQALYRLGGARPLDLVMGVGYDYWNRQLTPDQHEEYGVGYVRFGFEVDSGERSGWFGGAGLKYPFFVEENGHFSDIGFVPNTPLRPEGETSLYAQLGYRFNTRWSLAGYYDSYRFGESEPVLVTNGLSTEAFFQPKSAVDSFGLRLRYDF